MIAGILIAALVAGASPSPTVAPDQPASTPLRELVYNVSTTLRLDAITESFGGGPGAVPPASDASVSDHGTVTVDVMGKLTDGTLAIRVIERWQSQLRPLPIEGGVAPDGTVEFDLRAINAVTAELLPYFGTHFAPDGTLAKGTKWSVDYATDKISVSTDYVVTGVTGANIAIQKNETIKALGSETIEGTIVYEPSMLVPISGQIRKRLLEANANGQTAGTLSIRFELVSNTPQPPR